MFNQEVLQLEAWVSRFSLILMVSWCPKLKFQLFCFVNYVRLLTKVSSDSPSMKLINMITCVSMKNGYHLSKSSGLSTTCMAPKSPFSCIGTQPASNRLSRLFISGAAIAFSTSNSQPLHREHFAWDRSNRSYLIIASVVSKTPFVTLKPGGHLLRVPVLVGIFPGFNRLASYQVRFIQKMALLICGSCIVVNTFMQCSDEREKKVNADWIESVWY